MPMQPKGFIGFPDAKMKPVKIPDFFFTDLLPQIDDLAELKLTLHCFWLVNEQESQLKYLRGVDLRNDEVLLRSLNLDSDLRTPQQALVLLNDPTYVEASRALAARIYRAGGKTPERIQAAYRLTLQRPAQDAEVKILADLYAKHLAHYQANVKEAQALASVGYAPAPKDIPPGELAAWTSIARTVLNLHETITRD